MKFNLNYFLLTVFILIIEILIATTFKDIVFIRAYLGDILVVVLIYTFIMSLYPFNTVKLLWFVFAFACLIEVLQYFQLSKLMGFESNRIVVLVLGNTFSWGDLVCYGVGCFGVWVVENWEIK